MKLCKSARAMALVLLFSVNAHAALVSTAGGLGVYDTVNNVTWTSDGNLFATQAASYSGGSSAFVAAVIAASGGVIHDTPNGLDTVPNSGNYRLTAADFAVSGQYTGAMTWWGAMAWVNYLNAISYASSQSWSLPTTVDSDSSYGLPDGAAGHPSQFSSELAQLFYSVLGQVAYHGIDAVHTNSYAQFHNLQSWAYWSRTEYSSSPGRAWEFNADTGSQYYRYKDYNIYYAMAVAPGQVGALSAVPVPGAAWLLGSGLTALLGLRRRKA